MRDMSNSNNSNTRSKTTQRSISKNESVDDLTKRNVELVRQMEESAKHERKKSDVVAEVIARFCGSMTFVWVHVAWFGAWILINALPGLPHLDPFPFTFLTLVVSLEAIFLSTFILISQNHDTKISERRNHLDLQINLLSEQENTTMLAMLRTIAAKVGAELEQDEELEALSEATAPERLAKQIKAGEET